MAIPVAHLLNFMQIFGGNESILHQHCHCHGSHSTRDWRDMSSDQLNILIVNIANQSIASEILIKNPRDSNIDDGCPWLDHISAD